MSVDYLRTVIPQVQAENTHEMEAGSGHLTKGAGPFQPWEGKTEWTL